MPQITVTLSDRVYAAVSQLPKGEKSKFVNACVRDIYFNHCWQRPELVQMFMNGYEGFIQAEKTKILSAEQDEILRSTEAEESGESGFD